MQAQAGEIDQVSSEHALATLEGQLRECFGRVVYTHKTHEKQADILLRNLSIITWTQIVLSAITTSGIIATLIGKGTFGAGLAGVMSTVLLALNSYAKGHDLGGLAQKHRDTGAALWGIREKYLTLIVDMKMGLESIRSIQGRRDALAEELQTVYGAAPRTSGAAYERAQRGLQKLGDMTFSDEEMDAFVPKELKRTTEGGSKSQ